MEQYHPEFRFTVSISILLLVLCIVGFFYPQGLDWGITFLGFLPWYVVVIFILLSIVAILLAARLPVGSFIEKISKEIDNRPNTLLGITLFLFIVSAIIFRVKASILGDSYTLLYNFFDYQQGISILAPWHEPLSIYILYYTIHLLGPMQFPQLYASFSIAEIIFGCGFIVTTYFIVRHLFTDPAQRLLTFLLLLVLPYMEFYLGYIEVYSVSTLLLALYLLCSILVLEGRNQFWILPSLYVLVTFSHYINGLLGIALLYVAYIEYKRRNINQLVIGIVAAVVLTLGIFWVARFDPVRLIDISPMSHFLSLTPDISPINAYSQAYTIFSFYHAVDVANYFIFMSPFAIAFLIRWILKREIGFQNLSTPGIWLCLATVPILLFIGVAKIEQGFGSDWDVFAAHFFLLNLLFAYIFHQRQNSPGIRTFFLIVLMSLLFAAPWYLLNATREPSIKRFQSLWDQRILSHLGQYTHSLRLSRYYNAEGESIKNIEVWRHYTELFPGDPRGFENQIDALTTFAPNEYGRRDSVYDAWLHLDPSNSRLGERYSGFCITEGNSSLGRGDTARAILSYQKSIALDSTQSRAFNNLGSVYAGKGNYTKAIPLFEKAISLDPQYSDACYNLGMIYLDVGKIQQAEEMIVRSARLGNIAGREYLKSVHKSW
jgi:tetratricopeptide (TPR) repeat protein